jgi:hypothetical protein
LVSTVKKMSIPEKNFDVRNIPMLRLDCFEWFTPCVIIEDSWFTFRWSFY